ncbi:MAG TPA: Lrp/AsnC family transcriptional regulator [Anaerolineales bacterium]|jgi:Lrp/AsnC family transcriptional regulator for asnA, asnC and gidA|nr:Lrp/AsnC family transcriptional regulator [Anaerolineales bacterium]
MMDEIDLQILQSLQKDGRTPFTTIAKQTGVSESTIRARYAGLVEAGIVNTVSIVDPFALGFQAPAIIAINVKAGKIDEVGNAIRKFPEVSYLVMTLGTYDLIVEVFCRDLAHLTRFVAKDLQTIPGVVSTQTLMVAKLFKLSYLWSPVYEQGDHNAQE